MSTLEEENANVSEDIQFRWGHKGRVGKKNPNIQYYESFTYDGVVYFRYDSVYMWSGDQHLPHIAKMIEMYETPRRKKMVKVVWYIRPTEVQKWLRGAHYLNNELFLASGEGNGLFNFNPLESICGKCNVVCKSKDERNTKASTEELKTSDFVFYRTFDVENCRLSEKFPDKIAGVEVGHFFNPKPKGNLGVTRKSNSPSKCGTYHNSTIVLGVSASSSSDNCHSKNMKLQEFEVEKKRSVEADSQSITTPKKIPKLDSSETDNTSTIVLGAPTSSSSDNHHSKKRKLQELEVDIKKSIEAESQSTMLKGRQKLDTSEWFKKLPWEDRIQRAHQTGSLVLLENLHRFFTSSEVEDIVLDAFKMKVSAKMIQWTASSSPDNGQALVIFNSKDEADYAISELKTRCLIIGGARIVVGARPSLKEPGSYHPSKYFGHITIEAMKLKHMMDMKNAVSTSHHSQPNTIAFEMAMEWWAQQKKWELCRDALFKKQAEEIANFKGRLKGSKNK